MSNVDKNSEIKDMKLQNPIKTMLTADVIEENPEEIIGKDPDTNRQQLFKKTYDALLLMYPPEATKKKKRKTKEREELKVKQEQILNKVKEKNKEKVKGKEEKEINEGRER